MNHPRTARSYATAIVPVAGSGTRPLSQTEIIPTELLPIIDTPVVELVAAEAVEAGVRRLLIVTAPGQEAVVDHLRPAVEHAKTSEIARKARRRDGLSRVPQRLDVEPVIQEQALGLGHAIASAKHNLREEDDIIAVLLPDDLLWPNGILNRMAAAYAKYGGTVLAAYTVPKDQVAAYSVFDADDTEDDDIKRVNRIVQKPAVEQAPSNLVSVGRYLLDRAIFDALQQTPPDMEGETQLADAIALLIDRGHPVHVVVHHGFRHDLAAPAGFLRAAVDLALDHPGHGAELRDWLLERLATRRYGDLLPESATTEGDDETC